MAAGAKATVAAPLPATVRPPPLCSIVGDRTTVKHLQRIDPARFREEPWRARTRAALPKRITEVLMQSRALVQAAKGLK
jgi:hypothetical protein